MCLSPWVDMEALGESMTTKAEADPSVRREDVLEGAQAYLNGADPRTPLAAPLYADLTGLPPLLIQVGTAEVLLDDSTRLAERARSAGVDVNLEPWDDMIHVWQTMAVILPEAQQAIDRIGEFVRQHTGAKAAV
jgi:acetyl esterase/lipase